MLLRRKIRYQILLGAGVAAALLLAPFLTRAAAQGTTDPTPTALPGGAYITVIGVDGVNVRTGPGSLDYPAVVGHLEAGETAPAIGRSLKSEWIQIRYPDGPDGVGWVYAPLVQLTGGALPVVLPPPTPVPPTTPTLDPTFASAFISTPTPQPLPTFTPAPTLTMPDFHNPSGFTASWIGWVILVLGVLGLAGLVVSSLQRK